MSVILSSWVLIAIIAYLLQAGNVIMDKILLGERRISNPYSYAFYGGLWGILALGLAPFANFFVPALLILTSALLSGAASIVALIFFYRAMKGGEPSRVSTLLGGASPISVLVLSYLFFGNFIGGINLAAFLLLVIGGIVISYEPKRTLRGHRTTHISSIFLAAFFFALTFVLERVVFNHTPFLTGFIWTRIGAFLASLALLLYAPARIGIASWSPRRSMHTSGLFVINKVTAAVGFFFLSFSISQIPSATPESVGIVNALQGIQYVFIFLLALFFSVFYPSVLSEHTDAQTILLKSVAILLVVSGLFLLVCGQSFACGTVFGF